MPLARDILIDVLKDEGDTHIFGNPDSTETPLMDALVDHPEIAYVLGLQEATAVGMADGWAASGAKASRMRASMIQADQSIFIVDLSS